MVLRTRILYNTELSTTQLLCISTVLLSYTHGGVAERLKAPNLKLGEPCRGFRGFESHHLRNVDCG